MFLKEIIQIYHNKVITKTLKLAVIEMLMKITKTDQDAWIISMFHSQEQQQEKVKDN